MRTVLSSFALALALAGLAAGGGMSSAVPRAHATGTPCDAASGEPGTPIRVPQPYIGGAVLYASTNTGISGVTVDLYRCSGSTASWVASQSTSQSGAYRFDGLAYPSWYFVEVDPTSGPGGLEPVAPTLNPTALIGVGDGQSQLNLAFD